MSKKRVLILLLALLPLTLGSIYVGKLANGSRSTEISSLSASPAPQALPSDVADGNALPVLGSSEGTLPRSASTLRQAQVELPRVQRPERRIQSHEQPAPDPISSSEGPVERSGEVPMVAALGSHPPLYTPWSAGHAMSGGGAGGTVSLGGGGSGSDANRGPAGHDGAAESEDDETKKDEPNKEEPKKEDPKKDEPKKENPPEGETDQGEPSTQDPIGSNPIYIPPEETNPPVVSVPEPGTLGLLGLGLIGCAVARRRKASPVRGST